MQTVEQMTLLYIQGSLACAVLSVVLAILISLFYRDPLPRMLFILFRMSGILVLGITMAAVGFLIGMVVMTYRQVPAGPALSYQAYGGFGMQAGSLVGVTLGWVYAFWPWWRQRMLP